MNMSLNYYAVRIGRVPGVYTTWTEASKQVTGFAGAIHKKVADYRGALLFIEGKGEHNIPKKKRTAESSNQCYAKTPKKDNASHNTFHAQNDFSNYPSKFHVASNILSIYVDGACKDNAASAAKVCPTGWGSCITSMIKSVATPLVSIEKDCTSQILHELHGQVELAKEHEDFLGATICTNNTAELTAVGMSLIWLLQYDAASPSAVLGAASSSSHASASDIRKPVLVDLTASPDDSNGHSNGVVVEDSGVAGSLTYTPLCSSNTCSPHDDISISRFPLVIIHCDSSYAANSVLGVYNGSKNVELIRKVRVLLTRVRERFGGDDTVVFSHVKGHSNHTFNDRADALANIGAAEHELLLAKLVK